MDFMRMKERMKDRIFQGMEMRGRKRLSRREWSYAGNGNWKKSNLTK